MANELQDKATEAKKKADREKSAAGLVELIPGEGTVVGAAMEKKADQDQKTADALQDSADDVSEAQDEAADAKKESLGDIASMDVGEAVRGAAGKATAPLRRAGDAVGAATDKYTPTFKKWGKGMGRGVGNGVMFAGGAAVGAVAAGGRQVASHAEAAGAHLKENPFFLAVVFISAVDASNKMLLLNCCETSVPSIALPETRRMDASEWNSTFSTLILRNMGFLVIF